MQDLIDKSVFWKGGPHAEAFKPGKSQRSTTAPSSGSSPGRGQRPPSGVRSGLFPTSTTTYTTKSDRHEKPLQPSSPTSNTSIKATSPFHYRPQSHKSFRSRLSTADVHLYPGDHEKALERLGLDWTLAELRTPRSSLYNPLGRPNSPGRRTPGSGGDSIDDTPNGGLLAWLHVFAGWLVLFNTQ